VERAVDVFARLFIPSLTPRAPRCSLWSDYDSIIRNGHVVAISPDELDEAGCPQVTDATDKWGLPGMLGIHAYDDVEVLGGPALSESPRHGEG
jgi:N-acyl-D-aspartate/D-glutamate deacylase